VCEKNRQHSESYLIVLLDQMHSQVKVRPFVKTLKEPLEKYHMLTRTINFKANENKKLESVCMDVFVGMCVYEIRVYVRGSFGSF
jgi:hypothetical protein